MYYPAYSCQECPTPCFDFEETGICPKEAVLTTVVCDCCAEDINVDDIQAKAIPP